MEDQNRVQSAELCACSSQVETNDNRVKDDTEFEDEESSDLLAERALDDFVDRGCGRCFLGVLEVFLGEVLLSLCGCDLVVEVLVLVAGVELVVGDGLGASLGCGTVVSVCSSFGLAWSVGNYVLDIGTMGEAVFVVDILLCAELMKS